MVYRWLVTYPDGLPARKQSPIQVVTGPVTINYVDRGQRADHYTTTPDVRLPGLFGGKSVSLECITGQSQRSRADFRHFQASTEDLLLHVILDVLVC